MAAVQLTLLRKIKKSPYTKYNIPVPQCLSPRPNWDPPTPSTASECVPPLEQRGGAVGVTDSPAGEGWGRPK